MDSETAFRIILITEFSLFSIIRIQSYRVAKKAGLRTVIEESKKYPILLSILICYEVFTFFIYIIYPPAFIWAALSIPLWIRWVGASLGILALLWFVWIHRSLGVNFSVHLKIKEKQSLVTGGPYRWIRHPMYTAFYLLHISAFFLTANWFIGITWLAGLTVIIALRVKREEKMMVAQFGEEYNAYMKRTGRFFPPLKLKRSRTERMFPFRIKGGAKMNRALRAIISILACQFAGLIGSGFTMNAISTWYAALNKPAFTPPNWLFFPAWTTLYLLMGTAAFIVWNKGLEKPGVKKSLAIFLAQLVLNTVWSVVFFGMKSLWGGVAIIALLWVAILLTILRFYPLSRPAAWLMAPYLLWVTFATVLNISVAVLNP